MPFGKLLSLRYDRACTEERDKIIGVLGLALSGEQFLARWGNEGTDESLELVSEQVSHHPPVTAYAIWDKQRSVKLQGYNGQKASVSKALAINIKQVGHAILEIPKFKETYIITLPALHIESSQALRWRTNL